MNAEHHEETAVDPHDLFPPSEWAAFRKADTQAATAIVVLMQAIFVTGIVLYSIVLYSIV